MKDNVLGFVLSVCSWVWTLGSSWLHHNGNAQLVANDVLINTLFRKNAAQYTINTIHHYTKLKQYTNTQDKTKVRDKITKKNTFAE